MMNNIELSFCIPTYNRAQRVHRLVMDILLCSDSDIEVVVLDNGSTDNTLSILRAIKDERLFIYSNGENKGYLYNLVHVLNEGRGKYLVYSNDKDDVNANKIVEFKSFLLQHSGLACGYCSFNTISEIEYELFPKGYQAIKNLAYKERHPTGYFFNKKLLKSIKIVERFSDFNFVDNFPFEFAFAELCMMGNVAIYHGALFTMETAEMAVKDKSFNIDGKSKMAFFSPETRLKLAINYTKHVNTLPIAPRKRDLLIIDIFIHHLVAATRGYQLLLRNKDFCIHYHMECREMKARELFIIGLNFYKKFINETIDVWGDNFIKQVKFKTHAVMRIFEKMVQRLIMFK